MQSSRRWLIILGLGAVVLCASLSIPYLVASPAPAIAGPLNQALCRTYTSRDTPLQIPDNDLNGITSSINVPPVGYANAITITMDISHANPNDLQAFFCRSNGCCSEVFLSGALSDTPFDGPITFSDNGSAPIQGPDYPYGGNYLPDALFQPGNLSGGGSWKLNLADTYSESTGQLNAWHMTICTLPFQSELTATPGSAITPVATPIIYCNQPTRRPSATPGPSETPDFPTPTGTWPPTAGPTPTLPWACR